MISLAFIYFYLFFDCSFLADSIKYSKRLLSNVFMISDLLNLFILLPLILQNICSISYIHYILFFRV
nr:MAG TPA: hypothetical protein [Caudoviricetes sp.]